MKDKSNKSINVQLYHCWIVCLGDGLLFYVGEGGGGVGWAIFRGVIFFLAVKLFMMGNSLCKNFFKSNTGPGY